jgi:hypothetical protein
MKSEPSRFSETEKYVSEPLASRNDFTSVKETIYHTTTLNTCVDSRNSITRSSVQSFTELVLIFSMSISFQVTPDQSKPPL